MTYMKKAFSALVVAVGATVLLPVISFAQTRPARTQPAAEVKLEKAILTLRHIVQKDIPPSELRKKAQEVNEAWKTLIGSGQKGVARLKQELGKIDRTGEKDDFFKLSAATLLWQLGKLEQAGTIAQIWQSTPLHVQYNYVFSTAFEAALTQDLRALPMLKAFLKDEKGTFFVPVHVMRLRWPLTIEFVWGAFGPKGLPALAEVVRTSKDPVTILSAMSILSKAQYFEALPTIRKLAKTGKGKVRPGAVQALGLYGHPADYEFLLSGLASKDPREVWNHVYSLYEFGDLRASQHIIPLLASKKQSVRAEVLAALAYLLTPESLEAMQAHARKTKDEKEKAHTEELINAVLGEVGLDRAAYAGKTPKQRSEIIAAIHTKRKAKYRAAPKDRKLTHDQFLQAAADWKKRHRITAGKYAWVKSRHILAAATLEDLKLLLEVRASLYARLSDECLYEVRTLDEVIKRLARRRYRRDPCVCEKVEGLLSAESRPGRTK